MKMISIPNLLITDRAMDWLMAGIEGRDQSDLTYSPSTNWQQAGELIDKYAMGVQAGFVNEWRAIYKQNGKYIPGKTAQTAICRAVIAAKIGFTVDVPEEFMAPEFYDPLHREWVEKQDRFLSSRVPSQIAR